MLGFPIIVLENKNHRSIFDSIYLDSHLKLSK
jgi:hypothetical protein